jgi:hypothetical protein
MGASRRKSRLWRIVRIALGAFALCLFTAASATAAQPARIVAVGDLHGDYHAWLDVARDAQLIGPSGHWAGGKTVLVQMGDVLDRGDDSLKIVRDLQQLQAEAPRAGGKVVVVLGNHEAMNLLGDFRYTTPGEYAAMVDSSSAERRDHVYAANRSQLEAAYRAGDPALTSEQIRHKWMESHPLGWVERRAAWAPSGPLGKWAIGNPAVVRIGGTLFAHGGLSAEYAKLPLAEVNRRVAAAMVAGDDGAASPLNDPLGPLWYRGLVTRDADAEAERAKANPPAPRLTQEHELDAVLAAFDVKRLVIAHTPSLQGIQITDEGRLARIDTGMSRYYGGPLTWLEILGDTMIPHNVRRSTP